MIISNKPTLLQVPVTMSRRLHFESIHGQLHRLPMHHWGRFSLNPIIHSLTNLPGALRENCATECNFLVPFIIVTFLVVFVTFLLMIPMVIACLRSVQDTEHSLAIGMQVFFV